uniref:Ribosomal protein S13 n=1 Tax=Psammoneis japonica TaxID=517775 RepID=A0A2U9GIS9_9STRA|nr:ribosomal protein S13 [Psammoneis japonica]AWQ64269.1 ribosomal protein S13 [Psammoneis japonica]
MVYLLETKLLETKSIFFALSTIYGIGKTQSFLICKRLGFSINLKVKHLSNDQIIKILKLIEVSNLRVTSELKKIQILILKRLINIKSYRGLRRIKGLPVRGQRTHTNARSARKK